VAAVVEPVLSEEKLRSLLNEGDEQSCLDFKTTSDLSVTYDVVALVKDIAAMLSNELGGYIVIGAHDNGTPAPGLTARHLELFDESRLRAKITKYLPEPFDVALERPRQRANRRAGHGASAAAAGESHHPTTILRGRVGQLDRLADRGGTLPAPARAETRSR
jgi:hypothetical protein